MRRQRDKPANYWFNLTPYLGKTLKRKEIESISARPSNFIQTFHCTQS